MPQGAMQPPTFKLCEPLLQEGVQGNACFGRKTFMISSLFAGVCLAIALRPIPLAPDVGEAQRLDSIDIEVMSQMNRLQKLSKEIESEGKTSLVLSDIVVAACDLDKTLYPPRGPHHLKQLEANVAAMEAFERAGGIVFPVTGNNILLAQRKFMDPKNETRMMRDIGKKPGIFLNGAFAIGPEGHVVERWALGDVRLFPSNKAPKTLPTGSTDYVTALLEFAEKHKDGLLKDIGLAVFTDSEFFCFDGLECAKTVENLARMHHVKAQRASKQELLEKKNNVYLMIWCWPWASDVESTSEACKKFYLSEVEPKQKLILDQMKAEGLFNCVHCTQGDGNLISSGDSHEGIQLFPMRDPWPSIDMVVAGVSKGATLGRFLRKKTILNFLNKKRVDPARNVAVFGDAPNDISMFRCVQATEDIAAKERGSPPALRVAMPHADCKELLKLSNCVAEVGRVLNELAPHVADKAERFA